MRDKIVKAVNEFIENDVDLLNLNAHEQAVSHRLGVYLEEAFEAENLNVDCEYNKHLEEPKKINLYDLDSEECKSCKCESCNFVINGNISEIPERGFRPDILVHSRSNDDNNLIAIEIKKDKECPFDKAKLRALTKLRADEGEYEYDLGVFVWFVNKEPQYNWFVAGKEIQ